MERRDIEPNVSGMLDGGDGHGGGSMTETLTTTLERLTL